MSQYALVADIGGTNARFALVKEGQVRLEQVKTLACADYENIDHAAKAYLRELDIQHVDKASIALACPVKVEQLRMTNNHWVFTRDQLSSALDLKQLTLLNDFTAMALGMLEVSDADLIQIGGGESDDDAPRLVVGPGTGLGVSALVPFNGQWKALAAEGGHVSFAPTDTAEAAVWAYLTQVFGRVSVERILSGQGLLSLYTALADFKQITPVHTSPADISKAALQGDAFSQEVLNRFCRILGAVAGDAVLMMGARGGIYLCGGILPRMVDFFKASPFREGLESKGRFQSYMQKVPVWLCVAENPGLLGAAAAIR